MEYLKIHKAVEEVLVLELGGLFFDPAVMDQAWQDFISHKHYGDWFIVVQVEEKLVEDFSEWFVKNEPTHSGTFYKVHCVGSTGRDSWLFYPHAVLSQIRRRRMNEFVPARQVWVVIRTVDTQREGDDDMVRYFIGPDAEQQARAAYQEEVEFWGADHPENSIALAQVVEAQLGAYTDEKN